MTEDTKNPPLSEKLRNLHLSIILRAMKDIEGEGSLSTGYNYNPGQARDDALSWIRTGGKDFQETCEVAGVSPLAVKRRAEELEGEWDKRRSIPVGEWFTVPEAIKYCIRNGFKVSRDTLYYYYNRKGLLKRHRFGSKIYYLKESLDGLIGGSR